MHQEAFAYVANKLPMDISKTHRVVEFGSKDVNGNVNALLNGAEYVGVDREQGPNVDLVMDCREYIGKADIVLCLELLEHCDDLDGVIQSIVDTIDEKGIGIITCATTGRAPHSAFDGGPVHFGEYYKNITKAAFVKAVKKAGAKIKDEVTIDKHAGDLRAVIYVD